MSEVPLSRQVYNWLLDRILTRQLRPGDRLNRRQVAREVGVSAFPATEAMLQLAAEGFLETMPRRGTVVRDVDAKEVRDRLVLREALEAQAARMYCGEPVRQHKQRLMTLAREVDAHEPNTEANWSAEIAFHVGLAELSKSTALLEALKLVMRHSLFYAVNRLSLSRRTSPRPS